MAKNSTLTVVLIAPEGYQRALALRTAPGTAVLIDPPRGTNTTPR
ncbi:hypothetical protein GZL_02516 [Streptomyces sp. 769]|nr:hypothetical protein GZL_02516 [Streptomyces sp. 769]